MNNYQKLSFARSGCITTSIGASYYVGERGYGWSRTIQSTIYAYGVYLTPSSANPSAGNHL